MTIINLPITEPALSINRTTCLMSHGSMAQSQTQIIPLLNPIGEGLFFRQWSQALYSKIHHSEIEHYNILKSLEKYPFEHRIALDKAYRRHLDTIDIEGGSSNTRINHSVKNKLRARCELSEKFNQSLEPIDKTS